MPEKMHPAPARKNHIVKRTLEDYDSKESGCLQLTRLTALHMGQSLPFGERYSV